MMHRTLMQQPIGDTRLHLAAKHHAQEIHQEQELARIILETGEDLPTNPAALPGDTRKLRGIPCLARGIGGTITGTDPLRETIARERQRTTT